MHRMGPIDEHAARLPDRGRARSGTAAIGRAHVKRHACDADRATPPMPLDSEKRWWNRESRRIDHRLNTSGLENLKTAAAIAQVQWPSGAPSMAEVIDRLSTIRLLIS